MTTGYTLTWVGWNNEGTHDKVWGHLEMADGRLFAFWGRRGKALRFKQHDDIYDLGVLERSKSSKKGYTYVDPADYNELVEDFISDVEIWCMSAILSDQVM